MMKSNIETFKQLFQATEIINGKAITLIQICVRSVGFFYHTFSDYLKHSSQVIKTLELISSPSRAPVR